MIGSSLALVVFLGGIGGGIVFPILPILGVQLGLPGFLIGLILSANRITRLAVNPFTGAWVDRLGSKRPLTIGLLIEALSTATYSLGLHTSVPGWLFLAGRAIWGVGSSLLMVGGLTAALNASGQGDRGRATASVRLAQTLGVPAGLLVGGLIAGLLSNDAAFLFAAALAVIAAGIAWVGVPDVHVERTAAPARTSSRTANPVAGIVAQTTRVVAALRASGRELFADRRVLTIWVSNFLFFLSVQGMLLATLVLLIDQRHLTLFALGAQPTSGLLMAAMMLGSAGVTLAVGKALDRIPYRSGIAMPAVAAAFAGFLILAVAHSAWPALIGVVLLGIGMGGTSIPLITLLGDISAPERRGRSVGLYQFFGDAGGSLGPILGVEAVSRIGFLQSYLAVSVLLLITLPLLWRVRAAEHRARQHA